jgi:hypothetical protein
MSLLQCPIDWTAPAILKDNKMPTQGFAWIGDHVYDGTIAGAIRAFRTLPLEKQRRVEMSTEAGVIGGLPATFFAFDALTEIASRKDVPED